MLPRESQCHYYNKPRISWRQWLFVVVGKVGLKVISTRLTTRKEHLVTGETCFHTPIGCLWEHHGKVQKASNKGLRDFCDVLWDHVVKVMPNPRLQS